MRIYIYTVIWIRIYIDINKYYYNGPQKRNVNVRIEEIDSSFGDGALLSRKLQFQGNRYYMRYKISYS